MKHGIAIIVLLLVAACVVGQTIEYPSHGGWTCGEVRSMLDGSTFFIAYSGGDDQMIMVIKQETSVWFGIDFDDFISSPNNTYDEPLIWITDRLTRAVRVTRGVVIPGDSGMLRMNYQDDVNLVVAELQKATAILFRCYDYHGISIDAEFSLTPKDTVAALAWLAGVE